MYDSEELRATVELLFQEAQGDGQRESADLALETFVAHCVDVQRTACKRWYDSRGRGMRGARKAKPYRARLTPGERLTVARLLISGTPAAEVARRFEITRSAINRIAKGLKNEGIPGRWVKRGAHSANVG